MNNIHIAELLRENFTTINVQLNARSMESWTYKVLKNDRYLYNFKPGDFVLVPMPPQTLNAPPKQSPLKDPFDSEDEDRNSILHFPRVKAGIITEVHDEPKIDFDLPTPYKWIIGKLDMHAYTALVAEDEDLRNKFKKMQEDRARMSVKEAFLQQYPDLDRLVLK